MNDSVYLGIREGELDDKPYARYWNPEMASMQSHVIAALQHGEEAGELAFALNDARQLLNPGSLPLENGFAPLTNGQIFVAVRTDMPGVTGEMFEWWMGWHTMEHQRYKLWHPRAHVANGTREMLGDDPDRSNKEKYMTTHYVTEYIGGRLEKITITFDDPTRYFGDDADLTAGGTLALVCGRVSLQKAPITIGYLIHQIRKTETGSEMRSRFWLGKPEIRNSSQNDIRNKIIGSGVVRKRLLPPDLGREMVVHCAMEMNHLAGFLPALYADYHPESS